MKGRKFFNALSDWVAPLLVLSYAVASLGLRRSETLWGLPSTFWFITGGLMAILVLLIAYLYDKDYRR